MISPRKNSNHSHPLPTYHHPLFIFTYFYPSLRAIFISTSSQFFPPLHNFFHLFTTFSTSSQLFPPLHQTSTPSILLSLTSILSNFHTSSTFSSGLVQAMMWPMTLLNISEVIDNPWNVCTKRSANPSVSVMSMRCQCGVNVVSVWCQCDVNVASVWCQCGVKGSHTSD